MEAELSRLLSALGGLPSGISLPLLGLGFARLLPLSLLAPFFGLRGAALWARLALLLALSLALPSLLAPGAEPPEGAPLYLLLALRELALGALFSLVASAPLYGLRWAGRISDRLRLGFAPGPGRSPLGTLYLLLGLALFAAMGGHRLALAALAESLRALPPGAPWTEEGLAPLLGGARAVGWALAFSLSFAAPLMIALALLELSLGAAQRVAPRGKATLLAMPLRAVVALALVLLGLAVLAPHLPPLLRGALRAAATLGA